MWRGAVAHLFLPVLQQVVDFVIVDLHVSAVHNGRGPLCGVVSQKEKEVVHCPWNDAPVWSGGSCQRACVGTGRLLYVPVVSGHKLIRDEQLLLQLMPQHGVCLAAASLAVGDHGAVDTLLRGTRLLVVRVCAVEREDLGGGWCGAYSGHCRDCGFDEGVHIVLCCFGSKHTVVLRGDATHSHSVGTVIRLHHLCARMGRPTRGSVSHSLSHSSSGLVSLSPEDCLLQPPPRPAEVALEE